MNRTVCRPGRRWPLVLVCAVVVNGCAGVRYPKNYLLEWRPAATVSTASPRTEGALGVHEFQGPDYLCDGRIVYRPGALEVGFYEYHRWAMSPPRMIAESMAAAIRAHALFSSVALTEDADAAFQLTGRVERLEEVDAGREVRAVCALSAQLLDARTGSIIWSDSRSSTVQVVERDVPGVVSGLSDAARAAVDSLVSSLAKRLPPENPAR